MIDTIKLFQRDRDVLDYEYLNRTYDFERIEIEDYVKYVTKIGNMELSYDNHGIHVVGSAPRFINNSNIETLKHNELNTFIDSLSNAIGTDVSGFTVTRLDITDNLIMNNPPRYYKRHLGKCRYFQRVDYQHNGIQYINTVRKHTLYDKKAEQVNKGKVVPTEYDNKNLLRYEYSIMDKRKEYLKGINTLDDLTVPDNYLGLIDKWENMFNQIEKISYQPSVPMPYTQGMKPREYLTLLGAHNNGGIDETMKDIDEWVESGYCSQRIGSTVKKNLNKYQATYNRLNAGQVADRKEELIAKVKAKANENRDMI